jgi:RimJ/RimL family protein N-acetyltransferase
MDMDNAFRSANLVYVAVEDNDEHKAYIFDKISSDPVSQAQAYGASTPATKKTTADLVKYLANDALLAVLICQPADPDKPESKPTPVGFVNLHSGRKGAPWNRNTIIGICLAREHQGKGYGSEAINWVTDWAFTFGGMHKVAISAGSFNPGAERLYKRLGFIEEGRIRHDIFFKGEWVDKIDMGMLEDEWRVLRAKQQEPK